MQFRTTDDKQLWVYHIGEYRFPVYATPGEVDGVKHWRVVCAVFLKPEPFDMLSSVVQPVAINRFSGFWVIPDANFNATEKAQGITPDFYVKIPGKTSNGPREKVFDLVDEIRRRDPDAKLSDDFIKDVWQRTAICELSSLRLIWLTLCQEMPRWMLRTGKPVDLGWGKIWTFPFRLNWKQIVLSKFPNIWAFLRLPKAERDAKLEFTNFKDEMTCTDMAALSKSGPNARTVRWTVELDPNNQWWEYVDAAEKRVLEGTTKTGYLKRYATLLHRSFPQAIEVFRRFVQQTTAPSAAVLSRRGHRGKELVDYVHPGAVRPCNAEGLPVRVTTDSRGVAIRDSSTGRLVACEAAGLPEMPIVDFQSRDVRNAGGDGGEPGDRGEEAAGMLVQHADGSPTPG